MKKILFWGGLVLSLLSCSTRKYQNTQDLINATVWMQNSGEYKALTLQAYQLAQLRLTEILKSKDITDKPRAIVLDIDETILDNSPYQAYQIKNHKSFNQKDWNSWTSLAKAEPIAGALDFLHFAKDKGVEIFYLSNRYESERAATLTNLQKKNFPFADNEHLILKTHQSNKEERRQKITERYNIVLFFGDNLSDFSDLYYYNNNGKTAAEKVLENPKVFGRRFIILPNAMYGDWESTLYKKNMHKKLRTDQIKINSLRDFKK
ncbi:5'-nucleotidase, lipoprotein e(P4) family [Elizabethkingia argentiflava]|uniref:5'-nucleotidase, lipoprotein e(P4) family n=1 Tax=Elizabethkingia argenteiflava TaxID=2681556 RepID=A0A845PUY9_9FLAO|nr:5'-nucleotidase, lipoprotein e(P4) family [Elizabethkingia argenteiflava]NAW50696.1 5'-nucleotidase, lipoprotein e(P4) family [Elizabethkingia argenteiflava]